MAKSLRATRSIWASRIFQFRHWLCVSGSGHQAPAQAAFQLLRSLAYVQASYRILAAVFEGVTERINSSTFALKTLPVQQWRWDALNSGCHLPRPPRRFSVIFHFLSHHSAIPLPSFYSSTACFIFLLSTFSHPCLAALNSPTFSSPILHFPFLPKTCCIQLWVSLADCGR